MRKIVKTIGLVPFIFLICIGQIYAQEGSNKPTYKDYIFQVTASGCKGEHPQRRQTGFLIKQEGKSFIATALHGVIGCASWEANIVGGKKHEGLEIAKVDIRHDVALLGFDSDPYESGEGLVVERNLPKENDRDVIIRGYPKQAPDLNTYELTITESITNDLRTILSRSSEYMSSLAALRVRKSPDIDEQVLQFQGVLVPGYSGAPVFNREDHVIGIANGGLKVEDQTAWAIPWESIELKEVGEVQKDYDNLKHGDVSALLSAVFSQNNPALLIKDLRQLDLTFIDKTGSHQASIPVQVFEGIETWYRLGSQNIDLALGGAIKIAENGVPIADGKFEEVLFSKDNKYSFQVEDTRFGFLALHVKPMDGSACAFKVRVTEQGKDNPLNDVRAEITVNSDEEIQTYLGVRQLNGSYLFKFVCNYPVTVYLTLSHDYYYPHDAERFRLHKNAYRERELDPKPEYDKCRYAQGYFVREGDTLWDIAEEKGLAEKFREVTKKLFEIANEKNKEDPKSYAAISHPDRWLVPHTCIYIATENEITASFVNEDKRPSIYYYGFNLKEPPFNNSIIRRAFSLAVDREKIVGIITPERRPATTFTPPDLLGQDLSGKVVGLPFNPDKASALLADAGYAEGQSFPQVTLAYMKDRANEAVANAVVDMWQDHLGVNVKLQSFDNYEDYKELLNSDHPPSIFFMTWTADDPDDFLNTTFQKNRVPGGGQFNNDDFNRFVLENLYVKAEKILVEQEAAVIPIFHIYRNQH
jgi:hypothetical protein